MTDGDARRLRILERARLLDRIVAVLEADERVVAAWLGGSLGRGTGDAWSDVDLWVIVADERMAAVGEGRRGFVAAVGPPVLIEEAPQNAPAGGAYLLVLYGGETGAQQVDWYWEPRSTARVPVGVRVLFDRVGVPPVPPAAPLGEGERAAALSDGVAVFWVAVLLAAKAVARGRAWAATRMMDWAVGSMAEVEWLLDHDVPAGHDDLKDAGIDGRWTFPSAAAGEQLALQKEIAGAMAGLAPRVAALGGAVPEEGARQVGAFLEVVDGGGRRASRGRPGAGAEAPQARVERTKSRRD